MAQPIIKTDLPRAENIPRATDTTPMMTAIPPGATINPVHEAVPRATNLNPRGYTTHITPPAYPAQEVVMPATAANVNAINPLSSGLVAAPQQMVAAPLKAKTIHPIPAARYIRKRGDLLASSEDTTMMDHVRATHDVDAVHYKVKPLVHLIEDIMPRANAAIPGYIQVYIMKIIALT